jgi:hypothetical protein
MSLAGFAVLAIWNGVKTGTDDDFAAWHVREHIPERVGLPGFLRGRRYVAVEGEPKYFNFYETERIEDLSSSAYLARLDDPTPWTRAVVASFIDTSRTICHVEASLGAGDGAAIETFRLQTGLNADQFARNILDRVAPLTRTASGIVAGHLLRGDSEASSRPTAEKHLRRGKDEIADWILLLEAIDVPSLFALRRSPLSDAELVSAGVRSDLKRGVYRLQYALSKSQMAGS